MCRKRPVLYEVSIVGDLANILTAQEIRLRHRPRVYCVNLFRVDVINTAIGKVEETALFFISVFIRALIVGRCCWLIAINPHVSSQFHLVCARIILRVVGINICVAHMNGDVVPRCCQSVLICSFPSGRNFNRSVLRSLDCSFHQTGARKKSDEQENRLSHGGRRKYCIKGFLESPKTLCVEVPSTTVGD